MEMKRLASRPRGTAPIGPGDGRARPGFAMPTSDSAIVSSRAARRIAAGARCGFVAFLLLVVTGAVTAETEGAELGPDGLTLAEAVTLLVANDPNLALVATDVDSARGSLTTARGRFDLGLTAGLTSSDTTTPGADGVSEASALSTDLGLSLELRGGLVLEPGIALDRQDAPGVEPSNTATVSFRLRQPLLRGRGRRVVTADERSAERQLEASQLDFLHGAADRIAQMANQYWQVQQERRNLEILSRSEEASRLLLDQTRKLVAASMTPAAELVQLEADLAFRDVQRIDGERRLFVALQNLGRELGIEPREIAGLPLPAETYPELGAERVADLAVGELVRAGLERRSDLRAARKRLEAAEIALDVARDDLAPRLDLVLTPSYSSRVDGPGVGEFFSPVWDDIPGLSTSFSFELAFPPRNRRAEGQLIIRESTLRRAELEVERLEKQIGIDIPLALDGLTRALDRLARIQVSEQMFELALSNEEKKLRAGSSTLIDVISQRDRLIDAQDARNAAALDLALAIVELRFQTGTLVEDLGDLAVLDSSRLTTLPTFDAPRRATEAGRPNQD